MAAPPKPMLRAWSLFWVQIGLGVLGGIGTVIVLTVTGGSGSWAPVMVVFLLIWLGATVAGLWALERRKPLASAPASANAWASQVRELRDSRLEIVTAFEIERRRIERDLHDGAQQHLVAVTLKIGEAAYLLETAEGRVPEGVDELIAQAQDAGDAALAALRQTVAGVHPAVLSDLGLEAAIRDLAAQSAVEVSVRVPHRLPPVPDAVGAAAYFLVSEALTNVAKHAPQAGASVLVSADQHLHVSVVDDGGGGATVTRGHGLAGMTERLAAFGGLLSVSSPPGGPTWVTARIPLLLPDGQAGIDVDHREAQEVHE